MTCWIFGSLLKSNGRQLLSRPDLTRRDDVRRVDGHVKRDRYEHTPAIEMIRRTQSVKLWFIHRDNFPVKESTDFRSAGINDRRILHPA